MLFNDFISFASFIWINNTNIFIFRIINIKAYNDFMLIQEQVSQINKLKGGSDKEKIIDLLENIIERQNNFRNELYEKRKQEKIRLCEEYSIPLIQIYQSDIYSKTNQEIYETLLNYIDEIRQEVA